MKYRTNGKLVSLQSNCADLLPQDVAGVGRVAVLEGVEHPVALQLLALDRDLVSNQATSIYRRYKSYPLPPC